MLRCAALCFLRARSADVGIMSAESTSGRAGSGWLVLGVTATCTVACLGIVAVQLRKQLRLQEGLLARDGVLLAAKDTDMASLTRQLQA
jgi:hypothetical protein